MILFSRSVEIFARTRLDNRWINRHYDIFVIDRLVRLLFRYYCLRSCFLCFISGNGKSKSGEIPINNHSKIFRWRAKYFCGAWYNVNMLQLNSSLYWVISLFYEMSGVILRKNQPSSMIISINGYVTMCLFMFPQFSRKFEITFF